MRRDRNLEVFIMHTDWYTFDVNIGYVPTEKAPPEAVEAMKKYNSYS